MNVLEFITEIKDGGAETLVKDYCLMVNKQKISMKVLAIYPNNVSANSRLLSLNKANLETIYKRKLNLVERIANRFFGKIIIKQFLYRYIKKNHIDVIHVHLENLHYLPKGIKNVKIIYTCHNLPERFFSGKNKREFYAAKYYINEDRLQLIALHDDMRKQLNNIFGVKNTIVLHNGIDLYKFKNPGVTKNEERVKLGIPINAFVLGHVGRFSYQKNHEFLIRVFNTIHLKNSNAFLLLVGNGELQNDIEEQVKSFNLENHVLILSNRSDVNELLQAMDVFVFPSRFEGLSVTMVEAQAAGLKCVISDTINKETVLSKKTVCLGLEDPVETWVRAIEDDSLYNENFGNLEDFDMKKEIIKLEKIYIGEEQNDISSQKF